MLLLLLLGSLALGPPAPAPADAPQRDELDQLLRQVRSDGDRVDSQVFSRIAAFKTAESLKTLQQAVRLVSAEGVVFRAYLAFSSYKGQGDLEREAIDFLFHQATTHDRDGNQRTAARALTYFGKPAFPRLEQLLLEHPYPDVRQIVAQPLVSALGERGTPEAARIILDYAQIRAGRTGQLIREALESCVGEEVDRLLVARLGAEGTSLAWRELLLDVLAGRPGSGVLEALISALEDESVLIRVRAIEALGQRRDPELARVLQPHLRSEEELELRQAIVSLTRLNGAERDWMRKLFRYARSKRIGARMGAAAALADVRTPDCIEALHRLLRDDDWRVRTEAIEQVCRLRRQDSLELLIPRLGVERGRLLRDTARALRLLTGLDHGTSERRWREWFEAEGGSFRLPPLEQAAAAEAERRARRQESATTVSFYGLRLVSERVIFVLDTSGSMRSPAGSRGRTTTDPGSTGRTRLDVARAELERVLTRMSPKVRFNVVFFHTRVFRWKDGLIARSDSAVKKALGFANRQQPAENTNIYGALTAAFEDPLVDTIYLLSDGNPSAGEVINPDQIRRRIERANRVRKIQIHCISVGQPSPFLRALARENGGVYTESL